jgi:uncharacterized alkaline shock family protein YloU
MIAGKTIISEEVFIELARIAMSKVENLAQDGEQKKSLASIVKIVAEKVAPQINVKKTDAVESGERETSVQGTASFELRVSVLYGQSNIPAVVTAVRAGVKAEVEKITGYSVEKIDVTVERLVKNEPAEAPSGEE